MSITYDARAGDTWERIAVRVYGTSARATAIRAANPGVLSPLMGGEIINVPSVDLPRGRQVTADNPNETAVNIDGSRYRFWETIRITRQIDAVDTIEITAPFEHGRADFRETFRPFSYKSLTVYVGGELLFSGTMVGVTPIVTPDSRTVQISGYSTPGVLADVTAPASAYPLEFPEAKLDIIAEYLCAPFGIQAVFEEPPETVFQYVALQPEGRIMDFLVKLAQQSNLIIGSSPAGELVFRKSAESGAPVAELRQGEPPLVKVAPQFEPQDFYSHLTGIEPAAVGIQGSQATIPAQASGTWLPGVLRPYVFPISDTDGITDVEATVAARVGRMFGNVASYTIATADLRDPYGELWAPNTFVGLHAPDAMVYKPYRFLVRRVEFNRTKNTAGATLDLVLPGAFSGKVPERMPWEG